MPHHVLLPLTPYHLILATALVAQLQGTSQVLVVQDSSSIAQLARALADVAPEGVAVATLPGRAEAWKRGGTALLRADLVGERAMTTLRRNGPPSTDRWVFDDTRTISQALLRERPPNGRRWLVEDGAAVYVAERWPRSRRSRAARKLLHGPRYREAEHPGVAVPLDGIWATRPSFLRPELSHLEPHRLDLDAPLVHRLLARSVAGIDVGSLAIDGISPFVLLAEHSSAGDRLDRYAAIGAAVRATGTPLLVKHHPRETSDDPTGLLAAGLAWSLPAQVPAEALVALLGRRDLRVGSCASTALLSLPLLCPETRVVGLERLLSFGRRLPVKLRRAVGLEEPVDAEDLLRWLHADSMARGPASTDH